MPTITRPGSAHSHDYRHAPRRLQPPGGRRRPRERRRRRHLAAPGQGGAGRGRRRSARRSHLPAHPRRARADRHRSEPRSAGADAPLDRPPDGGGGDRALPRRAVRHRPGHRRGLLLRLRRAAAVRARGPRADRGQDARAGRAGSDLRAADVGPPGGDRVLPPPRRTAEGAADRGEDGRRAAGVGLHDQGSRHVRRLLRRPARAVDGAAEGVQADLDVERLLEGRRQEPADAAALRHGVPVAEGARRAPGADRGSEEARPSQGRQGTGPVHVPSRGRPAPRSGCRRARRSTTRCRTTCAAC